MSVVFSPYAFTKDTFFVYAMLCRDGEGPLYVKFGRSRSIGNRLSALRTSSPIPAKYFALVEVDNESLQKSIERALHIRFSSRRTTGEWFRFDPAVEEDKRAFNDGCHDTFRRHLGLNYVWQKISVAALDAHVKRQRAAKYYADKKRQAQAMKARRLRKIR